MTGYKEVLKKLYLPQSGKEIDVSRTNIRTVVGNCTQIESKSSIVIVGANGTGKTRLGTWLDLMSPTWEESIRISAQKSLAMPSNVQPHSIDRALNKLLYGSQNGTVDSKRGSRWGHDKSAIHFLNDFEELMVYLFSEEMDVNSKYTYKARESADRIEPPTTKLAVLKNIWESLLPHRELIVGGAKVETKVKGDDSKIYNSSEMSDGERVVFYLIGECLSAPENGVIIIDEPELHLHKSLQYPLWKKLEETRSDCLFIYITHDVEFAASQSEATKIWLKDYDGKRWQWVQLNKETDFPEDLLLEILGSRRKVIFVEGDNGSHDLSLYRILFPDHLVVPRGGCAKVISDVKTLRKLPYLLHLDIIGIIDRDRRVDEEIKSLEKEGIYVLSVAEVENLFCVEEVVNLCCEWLARDYNEDIISVRCKILKSLASELENQVSMRVVSEIKFRLNVLDEKSKGREGIKLTLNSLISRIDVDAIYTEVDDLFKGILNRKNLKEVLKYYNRKSLKDYVGSILELKDLPSFIIRQSNKIDNGMMIKNALKSYFSNVPGY
ncbi:DUF4435 domain-containing protein [Serratia fonticola]|uniref:AAA family ATPase n=1 Tax=Serratia fonticola TaxID=47917 RepID=A0AAW3WW02_SERFO|nr:AAA family ATPase [Serratia fonticola]MBC3213777.1 AAA family ATPase [Serratia fonticola]NYA14728.1 AAA family ATPase [Serratia fonticola]NYA34656.1 AAA family ATPase [Serratia fonticola]